MQIELSQSEMETLLAALEVWEKEQASSAFVTEMLTITLAPPERQEQLKAEREIRFVKLNKDMEARKYVSLMLRAKLVQTMHSILTAS